ncbi:hypothetical protein DMB95_06940 [Campylobacter sp. MIT 12-8780]|nr:hypothetical protein DMB95_06940 [Campylobacter sp. MIT 12-8780]
MRGGRFLNLKNQTKYLFHISVFKSQHDLFKFIFDEIYHFSNAKDTDLKIAHLCNIAIILLKEEMLKQDDFTYNKLEITPKEYLEYLVGMLNDISIKLYQDEFFLAILNLIYTLGYDPKECIKTKLENLTDQNLSFKNCKNKEYRLCN